MWKICNKSSCYSKYYLYHSASIEIWQKKLIAGLLLRFKKLHSCILFYSFTNKVKTICYSLCLHFIF